MLSVHSSDSEPVVQVTSTTAPPLTMGNAPFVAFDSHAFSVEPVFETENRSATPPVPPK